MNILINLSTLKKGGGLNVGLNFILSFSKMKSRTLDNYYFIVPKKSSLLEMLCLMYNNDFILQCPQNPLKRLLFEISSARKFILNNKIDIIYSYFGWGIFPKRVPQIVGSADSNLYFPEIKFWKDYKGLVFLKKKIIDKYRIVGLKKASGIVFETDLLEKRCHELFNVNAITKTIKPSISFPNIRLPFLIPSKFAAIKKGLFLCSWQLNKNVMKIPEIACCLKEKSFPFLFILTAPKDRSDMSFEFTSLMKKYRVEDYIFISGAVSKEQLCNLYNQIDIVFLLSKLESFSNNIIEAWYYKKLLLISDELWARDICKDSAVYVNRDSASNIAKSIMYVLNDKIKYSEVIYNGLLQLKSYPSIEQRTMQEISFIKQVYEKSI